LRLLFEFLINQKLFTKGEKKMLKFLKFFTLAGVLLVLLMVVPLALAQEANQVEVTLIDGQINMVDSLPAGPTTFMITNEGTHEHSFEIEGQGIEEGLEPHLQPGENGTLEVDLQPGTYEVYCPVGNHRTEGMLLNLTVTEAGAAETTGETAAQPTAEAVEETTAETAAQPTAEAPQAEQPATLPTTGGELIPWFSIVLVVVGGMALIGALVGLAMARRTP
jgi:hypothetical protein